MCVCVCVCVCVCTCPRFATVESLLQELAAQPGCSVEEVTGTFGGASSTPQEEEQSVSAAAGEGEKENGESEEDEGACAFEVKPIIPTKVPPVAEGEGAFAIFLPYRVTVGTGLSLFVSLIAEIVWSLCSLPLLVCRCTCTHLYVHVCV